MKEKPIIFSTDMVKAILAGKKTQTRRVIKPQPKYLSYWTVPVWVVKGEYLSGVSKWFTFCPYQTGQTLWVRETWIQDCDDKIYKADSEVNPSDFKWKPSIFMPRSFARIFLKITNIRVERIQDISEEDVKAEGFTGGNDLQNPCAKPAIKWFFYLWNAINKKRGFGWDVNPWVWVIEFERIKEK